MMSCSLLCNFIEMVKYRPAGPPPTQTIFMYFLYHGFGQFAESSRANGHDLSTQPYRYLYNKTVARSPHR